MGLIDKAKDTAGELGQKAQDVAGEAMVKAAQAFAAGDPYNQAGLFERVDIHAYKATLGGFA